ncbi:MAG TPA: hypothetical protein VNO30_19010 [Kofleriaceae bacterium]|nr:hypothetical protein [Kofleriaceae bacterium]
MREDAVVSLACRVGREVVQLAAQRCSSPRSNKPRRLGEPRDHGGGLRGAHDERAEHASAQGCADAIRVRRDAHGAAAVELDDDEPVVHDPAQLAERRHPIADVADRRQAHGDNPIKQPLIEVADPDQKSRTWSTLARRRYGLIRKPPASSRLGLRSAPQPRSGSARIGAERICATR